MDEVTNSGIIQTGGHMRIEGSAIGDNATVSPRHTTRDDGRPAVRLCLAADVERYSRLRTPAAARAQAWLVDVLAQARAHAGIDESTVDLQHAGDGQFAVLPPGLDESSVIPALIHGLESTLRDLNADLNDHARLRLRVALHRGHIGPAPAGWVGDSVIAVHRLLDAPALRQALRDRPDADFALIVPDMLYRDVVRHLPLEDFNQTTVNMPEKNFTEHAWIQVGNVGRLLSGREP
jgi:hypothetical protein